MNHNEQILVYPDDGDELIYMYLPGGEKSPQMRELKTLEAYSANRLDHDDPRFLELNALPHAQVWQKLIQMRKTVFQLSLFAFVSRACQRQNEICEQNFWDAPAGDEAEWIANSVMPDIYEKGQYERLETWWAGLGQQRQMEIISDNAELWEDQQYDLLQHENCIDRFWGNIRVDQKEEIYQADPAGIQPGEDIP